MNWVPFVPFGWRAVVTGSSSLFFAYVGFDEVATVAEEARSPSRNVPRAMMISLAIVSGICALASVVITGIQPYSKLSETAPFAKAFEYAGSGTFARIVSIGTIIGLQNTAMVALLAQPRLFVAMSRDGLLPEIFGELSGAGNTPRAATILCGIGLAVVALLFPLHSLSDMISGGTLIAYTAVCISLIRTRLIVSGHGRDSGGLLTLLLVSFTLCALIWRVGNESLTSLMGGGFIAGVPLLLLVRVPLACEPDPPNFKCPLVPWTPAFGAFFSVVLLFQLSHTGLFLLLIWVFLGVCTYALYGFKHSHTRYMLPPDFVAAAPSGSRITSAMEPHTGPESQMGLLLQENHRPDTSSEEKSDVVSGRSQFHQIDLLDEVALEIEDEMESVDEEGPEFSARSV
jgi:APA family basic amino acid/polyamine antiporter